jgi:hypothetical protein
MSLRLFLITNAAILLGTLWVTWEVVQPHQALRVAQGHLEALSHLQGS